MKPIKLTICGINSYVTSQTINFEKLSEGNLFGIFGQTGSGKSTILDSIILSLYGSTTRDNLSNLINVNLTEASLDFEFEIEKNEVQRYLVKRTFKVRPSGFKSTAELINLTVNKTIADTTDLANLEISKLIGIGKNEFLKCIALPQNEFDKFILDTPQDRKKSIAKLFNLESFGEDLNKKLKHKIDVLFVKQTALTERLNLFMEVTESFQEKLQIEINNLADNINAKKVLLDKNKVCYKENLEEFDKIQEYNAINIKLSDIMLKEPQFTMLQNKLDFYSKNKENLEKQNELTNNIKALDNKKHFLAVANLELTEYAKNLKSIKTKCDLMQSSIEKERLQNQTYHVQLEKNKLVDQKLMDLNNELQQLENNKSIVLIEYNKLLKNLENSQVLLDEKNSEAKNITSKLEEINRLLIAIENIKTASINKSFIDKLKLIKNQINGSSLVEIKGFKIYENINNAIEKINSYITQLDNEVKVSEKILDNKILTATNFEKEKTELLKQQSDFSNLINAHNTATNNLNNEILNIKYELKNCERIINENKNNTLKLLNKQKEVNINEKSNLHLINNIESLNNLEKQLQDVLKKKESLEDKINNTKQTINNLKFEIDYLVNSNKQLKAKLPNNLSNLKSDINENNFEKYKNEINQFLENKTYYSFRVNSLKQEIKNNKLTFEIVENLKQEIANDELYINNAQIELGIKIATFNKNNDILAKNKTSEKELILVNKELNLAQELLNYVSKNALVDYVSEEYLILITEYANKFVRQLSRGKFMIYFDNFTSEFMAIDNFNAGTKRTIKSLSGGERFIFSLSLALGISQSIAVNNNKNFNFFFIDEGFGSLSEDYIDEVLDCFNSLMRMNFTICFITHVDKMQEFINNKVIVSKENNEKGSVIKQYF